MTVLFCPIKPQSATDESDTSETKIPEVIALVGTSSRAVDYMHNLSLEDAYIKYQRILDSLAQDALAEEITNWT